jgi:hypothetical protein
MNNGVATCHSIVSFIQIKIMDAVISKIKKNASEEIWITLGEFKGHDLLNMRVYFQSTDGPQPTRKGFAINVSLLTELRDALSSFVGTGTDTSKTVTISKNKKEQFRIYRSEYMGHLLMNVRVFFSTDNETELKPSPKGIAFNVNLLHEIIHAVELAIKTVSSSPQPVRPQNP